MFFNKCPPYTIYMKMGKSDIEHQADIILNMTNLLGARFFKFAKELTDKGDMSYLTELAKSIGYLTGVSSGINKTFKNEKRLQRLEEKVKNPTFNMQMFDDTPLEKFR